MLRAHGHALTHTQLSLSQTCTSSLSEREKNEEIISIYEATGERNSLTDVPYIGSK